MQGEFFFICFELQFYFKFTSLLSVSIIAHARFRALDNVAAPYSENTHYLGSQSLTSFSYCCYGPLSLNFFIGQSLGFPIIIIHAPSLTLVFIASFLEWLHLQNEAVFPSFKLVFVLKLNYEWQQINKKKEQLKWIEIQLWQHGQRVLHLLPSKRNFNINTIQTESHRNYNVSYQTISRWVYYKMQLLTWINHENVKENTDRRSRNVSKSQTIIITHAYY